MTIPPRKQHMKTTILTSFSIYLLFGCGPTEPVTSEVDSESANEFSSSFFSSSFGMSDSSISDSSSNTTDITDESIDKRIFVTRNIFSPVEIQGLAGADNICQNIAKTEMLGGIWKAILSDDNNSFKDRIILNNNRYVLVDRTTMIANSLSDLLDGNIFTSISMTENGITINPSLGHSVWTGSLYDGSLNDNKEDASTSNCYNWTVGKNQEAGCKSDYAGTYGNATKLDDDWIDFGIICCDRALHLYCIEE